MRETAVRLLAAAGILMLLAGVPFGFMERWIDTALLWVGALGCFVGALNFRNWNG